MLKTPDHDPLLPSTPIDDETEALVNAFRIQINDELPSAPTSKRELWATGTDRPWEPVHIDPKTVARTAVAQLARASSAQAAPNPRLHAAIDKYLEEAI